jgi:hypothetical protein
MFLFRQAKKVRENEYERLKNVYQMGEIIMQKSSCEEPSFTVPRYNKNNNLVRKY